MGCSLDGLDNTCVEVERWNVKTDTFSALFGFGPFAVCLRLSGGDKEVENRVGLDNIK